nr:MAG TPA: hypothetical protein [Caudoviricetes sp.]
MQILTRKLVSNWKMRPYKAGFLNRIKPCA